MELSYTIQTAPEGAVFVIIQLEQNVLAVPLDDRW
jgi:hypothetical protein